MWVNPKYRVEAREAVIAMMTANPLAALVVAHPLRGSHMPLLVEQWDDDGLVLIGHIPRADPVAEAIAAAEPMLAIFTGAVGYVSSGWYRDVGLPTYNFTVVHATGTTEAMTDEDDTRAHLLDLIASREARKQIPGDHPWQPGSEALQRMEVLLPRIIGFRLRADEVQAKAKLGQNRSVADRVRAAAKLDASTRQEDGEVARQMREALRAEGCVHDVADEGEGEGER